MSFLIYWQQPALSLDWWSEYWMISMECETTIQMYLRPYCYLTIWMMRLMMIREPNVLRWVYWRNALFYHGQLQVFQLYNEGNLGRLSRLIFKTHLYSEIKIWQWNSHCTCFHSFIVANHESPINYFEITAKKHKYWALNGRHTLNCLPKTNIIWSAHAWILFRAATRMTRKLSLFVALKRAVGLIDEKQ